MGLHNFFKPIAGLNRSSEEYGVGDTVRRSDELRLESRKSKETDSDSRKALS